MSIFTRTVSGLAAQYAATLGHDITSLAVLWTLALGDVPTTLISTDSVDNMNNNLVLARKDISEEEAENTVIGEIKVDL